MKGDDALDRAIDQVARALTEGTPPHGFAARVRECIERPRQWRMWVWQAAGAIAVLALVAFFQWPRERATAPQTAEHRATTRPVPPPPDDIPGGPGGAAPSPTGRTWAARSVAFRRPAPAMRITIDEEQAPQIAALSEVDELTVPEVRARDLTLAGLDVREVTIPPLETDDKEQR